MPCMPLHDEVRTASTLHGVTAHRNIRKKEIQRKQCKRRIVKNTEVEYGKNKE
jgi:hypothetical protein